MVPLVRSVVSTLVPEPAIPWFVHRGLRTIGPATVVFEPAVPAGLNRERDQTVQKPRNQFVWPGLEPVPNRGFCESTDGMQPVFGMCVRR